MPREHKIRWTEAQWRRLDSAVRVYNNAIRREKKKNPEAELYLPKEVSYRELKQSITTARALKNTVNRLNRIKREGALRPIEQDDKSITTAYERHEYAILKSVRERQKAKRKRELEEAPRAKGTLGSYKSNELEVDNRPIGTIGAKAISRFIEMQERELNKSYRERAEAYFKNYKAALTTVFGPYERFSEDYNAIWNAINWKMRDDPEGLLNLIDESPSIRFIYDPYTLEERMKELREFWEKYYDEDDLYAAHRKPKRKAPKYHRAKKKTAKDKGNSASDNG